MHAELAAVDAKAAARIQPNDAQRIQRALEVYLITGKTLSDLHAAAQPAGDASLFLAYAWVPNDREQLYAAIETRFHHMMEAGLLAEVQRLYERGDLNADLPSIRSVGYRQIWEHLRGSESLEAAIQRAIVATRHLARRQLIWLRSEREVQWVDALETGADAQMVQAIESVLNERRT
jgi:tRNA dimethylallyltransferase